MKSKFCIVLVIVFTLVMVLAGCKAKAAAEEEAAPAETTTAETTTATEEISKGEPTILKVCIYPDQINSVKAYDGITDGVFEKENNVTIEYIPFVFSLADNIAKFNQLVSAKDGEWAVLVNAECILPLFAETGLFLPLDGLFPKDVTDDLIQWEFYTFGGKHWGWNWVSDTNVWYLRKDIMIEKGLDPDKPITNLDEMWDVCDALTTKDSDGNTTMSGFTWQAGSSDAFGQFFSAFGGKLYNDDGSTAINSPEAAEGLEYMTDMFFAGIMAPDAPNSNAHSSMLDQISASCWSWPYYPAFLKNVLGAGNISYKTVANNDGAIYMSGHAYFINGFASPEDQDLAAKWIAYFNSPDAHRYYSTIFAIGPPYLSMLLDEDLRVLHPEWEIVLEQMKTRTLSCRPGEELGGVLTQAFTDVVSNNMTPQEALDIGASTLEPNLNAVSFGGFKIGNYWKERLAE